MLQSVSQIYTIPYKYVLLFFYRNYSFQNKINYIERPLNISINFSRVKSFPRETNKFNSHLCVGHPFYDPYWDAINRENETGWDSVGRQQEAKYNFQFCDVIRIDRSEHEFQIVVEAQHRRLYHANSVFCLGVRTNKNTRRNLWNNGTSFSSWDGRRELVVCRVIEPGVIHPVNPFDPNLWNRVRNCSPLESLEMCRCCNTRVAFCCCLRRWGAAIYSARSW